MSISMPDILQLQKKKYYKKIHNLEIQHDKFFISDLKIQKYNKIIQIPTLGNSGFTINMPKSNDLKKI
jgi:hypothetical protein